MASRARSERWLGAGSRALRCVRRAAIHLVHRVHAGTAGYAANAGSAGSGGNAGNAEEAATKAGGRVPGNATDHACAIL